MVEKASAGGKRCGRWVAFEVPLTMFVATTCHRQDVAVEPILKPFPFYFEIQSFLITACFAVLVVSADGKDKRLDFLHGKMP